MTPYNYDQYYLACINDSGLFQLVHAAYPGYRGPLNKQSPCYHNLCTKIDRHCRHMYQRFRLEHPISPVDKDELYHAIIFRLLNGEDHPSVRQDFHEGYGTARQRERDARASARYYEVPATAACTMKELLRERIALPKEQLSAGLSELAAFERLLATTSPRLTELDIPKPTKIKPIQGEPAPMSTDIKIEQRTFLNGIDVTAYTDSQLIQKIEQAEAEIKRLSSVKTSSLKIKARIAELEEGAAQLAALLDRDTPKTDA